MLGLNETPGVLDPSMVENARKMALDNFISNKPETLTRPGKKSVKKNFCLKTSNSTSFATCICNILEYLMYQNVHSFKKSKVYDVGFQSLKRLKKLRRINKF